MGKARMRIDSRVLQMAEDKKKGVLYIYDTVQNDGYDWWNGEKIVSETSEAFIRDRLAEWERWKSLISTFPARAAA